MSLDNPKLVLSLEILFFATLAYFNFHTYVTTDFWFHLKTGEQIIQTASIPFTETFSHSVYGKPIIPYEWLYQAFLYLIYSNFGFAGTGVISVLFLLAYFLLYRQILAEIFKLGLLPRMVLGSVLMLVTYSFWSERPQIMAFCGFMAVLYLILKRVFLGKNLLWITIPIFWIWTNLHASMVLGLALFGSYFLFFGLKYLKKKDKGNLKGIRDFGLVGGINLLVTILPPLGTKVYQLLWKFYENKELISNFINEWMPLTGNQPALIIYTVVYSLSALAFIAAYLKSKDRERMLLYLPLLPVGLFALTGTRQSPFSLPIVILFITPFIMTFHLTANRWLYLFLSLLSCAAIGFFLNYDNQLIAGEVTATQKYYPEKALPFIKQNLKGNMFNDFNYGGFLLYSLGPEQKVFVDGRTEMYVPEVFVDAKSLGDHKYEGEDQIMKYFNAVVDKYNISWVILPSENFNVWRILIHPLYLNPNWSLVYFDDTSLIFVRDDHKNDETIKQFGLDAVTPFQKSLFKEGQEEKALEQYRQMFQRTPSSAASNSIGYFLFKQKKVEEAKPYFEKAVEMDPSSASAKVNLAETYVKEGRIDQAITLYRQALLLDPQRDSAAKRLSQLEYGELNK